MILLIDDEVVTLRVIREALSKFDSEILSVSSGKEAKELVADRAPDLIICDILMPDIDGFQLFTWYRESFPFRRTPFVFCSSLDSVEDEIKGLRLGADHYFYKPINPELLQARVQALLRLRRRSLSTTFEGKLHDYPAVQILQFCKRSGLTGAVKFFSSKGEHIWTFKGGNLLTSPGHTQESILAQLPAEKATTFQILATPPNFDELEVSIDVAETPEGKDAIAHCPPGILSGFQAGNNRIDIQTEIQVSRDPIMVSSIFANGQLLKTFHEPFDLGWEPEHMSEQLRRLHLSSEKETRERLTKKQKLQG